MLPRPHIDDADLVRIVRRNAIEAFDSSFNNLDRKHEKIINATLLFFWNIRHEDAVTFDDGKAKVAHTARAKPSSFSMKRLGVGIATPPG